MSAALAPDGVALIERHLAARGPMVPVYDWLLDGESMGCGTAVELDHCKLEGTAEGYTLGKVLCREPASEDERRRCVWAKEALR